jgi:hypothetical protein
LATVYSDDAGQFTLLYAPQNLCFKVVLNSNGNSVTKLLTITAPTAIITITNSDFAATGTVFYKLSGQLKDCDEELYSNKYYRLLGLEAS